MPLTLSLSPAAKNDLADIWAYIAADDSVTADRFVDTLHAKCLALTHAPRMGRGRDELIHGLRSFPFQNYVIFYRHSAASVEIVRVLHGARDIGPALF
jgi:toxin ParE1/3/4